jgi:hypothetical protein
MRKPKPLSELLSEPGKALRDLSQRLQARAAVLDLVRAAVPAKLAPHIVSAGIDQGRLTIGVTSAVWASRLRYGTAALRHQVQQESSVPILRVRIRVLGAP